jgi:hypothetical protein
METTSNMYHGELVVVNELNIVGRGHILVVDLQESGLVSDKWVSTLPIVKDDLFDYKNKIYEVVGIEAAANLLDGKHKSIVGLIVKEI